MTWGWEAVSALLVVIGAAAAWVRNGYTDAIKLSSEQMKNESLRAINELRHDCDDRYPSKAEWKLLVQQVEHIRDESSERVSVNRQLEHIREAMERRNSKE